jgi:hypothetical protein
MKKIALVVALGLLTVLVGATPAAAKSPHVVDPATVTPALNPDFAPWSCFRTGKNITCQGSYHSSYENEEMDFTCDGQPVYISGSGREFMTRWHDAEGRATRTIVHLDYPADVFSLSPTGEGPSVTVRGHFNRHYVYPVPGDRDTRVLTEVGAIYLVNLEGQGIVVHDTGLVTFQPGQDFEEIAVQHGVHDVYDDFDGFVQTLCDALIASQ